ncbi:MAG: hypothetical protein V1754_11465 [Pseudomonadota bacterium]
MANPSPSGRGRRKSRENTGTAGSRRRRRRPRNAVGRSEGRYIDRHLPPEKDKNSVLGGRELAEPVCFEGPPDAFGLFCSYHLGITQTDGYRKASLDSVARRYNMTPEEVEKMLTEFELDENSVKKSSFDIVSAQLDIRLAPQGISRTETARGLFEEYQEALGSK